MGIRDVQIHSASIGEPVSAPNSTHESRLYVLVEGPRWGDAEFYGKWLVAASKAEALWKLALRDAEFAQKIERVIIAYTPNFGIGASVLLSQLKLNLATLVVYLLDDAVEMVEEFVMLKEMGFFKLTGNRYQMVIPTRLTIDKVKSAALTFAQTEDGDSYLHAEFLLSTMSLGEAKDWEIRLRAMEEQLRQADRELLLEN